MKKLKITWLLGEQKWLYWPKHTNDLMLFTLIGVKYTLGWSNLLINSLRVVSLRGWLMNRKKHRHPSYKKGCATTPYALINFAVFYRFKGWLTIMPFCRRWIRGEPACCPPRSPNPWRCRSSWTGTPCHFHDRFPFQKVRDCKVADQSWDAASTHVHARKIDKNRRKRLMTLPVLTGPRIWHFFDYLDCLLVSELLLRW